MANLHVKVNVNKIKKLARMQGRTLKSIREELEVKSVNFDNWLYKGIGMPPETYEKLCEILGVDDYVLRDPKEDMGRRFMDRLDEYEVVMDTDEGNYELYALLWKTVAPYLLSRPRDLAEKESQIEHRESIRKAMTAILQAGEDDD